MSGFVSSECGALFSAMLAFVSTAPKSVTLQTITRVTLLARLPFAMVVPRFALDDPLYRDTFR